PGGPFPQHGRRLASCHVPRYGPLCVKSRRTCGAALATSEIVEHNENDIRCGTRSRCALPACGHKIRESHRADGPGRTSPPNRTVALSCSIVPTRRRPIWFPVAPKRDLYGSLATQARHVARDVARRRGRGPPTRPPPPRGVAGKVRRA